MAITATGCRHLRLTLFDDETEERRKTLLWQREEIQKSLDRNAPTGSRWDSHPDTMKLLDASKRIDNELSGIN